MSANVHDMGSVPSDWFALVGRYLQTGIWDGPGQVPIDPDTDVPADVRAHYGIKIDPDLAMPRKANGRAHKMDTGTKSPPAVEPPALPNLPPKLEPSPPEPEQPSSRENYNLDDLGIELRKALNRVTASLVVAKRDSVQVLKAVRTGAAALAEFDQDPGYDIAIAHLQAVARDRYMLSVDDIQVQISAGTQDALERRARDQANSGSKRRRQRDRNLDPPTAAEPEDHGLPTSEDAVWSSEDAIGAAVCRAASQ